MRVVPARSDSPARVRVRGIDLPVGVARSVREPEVVTELVRHHLGERVVVVHREPEARGDAEVLAVLRVAPEPGHRAAERSEPARRIHDPVDEDVGRDRVRLAVVGERDEELAPRLGLLEVAREREGLVEHRDVRRRERVLLEKVRRPPGHARLARVRHAPRRVAVIGHLHDRELERVERTRVEPVRAGGRPAIDLRARRILESHDERGLGPDRVPVEMEHERVAIADRSVDRGRRARAATRELDARAHRRRSTAHDHAQPTLLSRDHGNGLLGDRVLHRCERHLGGLVERHALDRRLRRSRGGRTPRALEDEKQRESDHGSAQAPSGYSRPSERAPLFVGCSRFDPRWLGPEPEEADLEQDRAPRFSDGDDAAADRERAIDRCAGENEALPAARVRGEPGAQRALQEPEAARLDPRRADLDRVAAAPKDPFVEDARRLERVEPVGIQQSADLAEAQRADGLRRSRVPEEEVLVPVVERIELAPAAAPELREDSGDLVRRSGERTQ